MVSTEECSLQPNRWCSHHSHLTPFCLQLVYSASSSFQLSRLSWHTTKRMSVPAERGVAEVGAIAPRM